MIWGSPFLMAAIDVVIVSAAVFAVVVFYQHRQAIRRLGAGGGVAWLLFGLLTLAVFYSFDLFTMVLLPSLTTAERAAAVMMDLHINWSWPASLVAVGAIAFGLFRLVHYLLPETGRHLDKEIGERARAGAALHESEHRLRLITDSVPALISFVDNEERYRFVNRTCEEWFGLPRSEIVGQRMAGILGPAAYEIVRPHVSAALAGAAVTYETELIFAFGTPRHVRASYIPEVGDAGEVTGFFVLAQDITERKRAEMAVRGSEAHIRAIMDNVVDGVVTIDEAGKVDSFNAAAQRIFGYAADEVLGENVAMLMAEPDRSRHDAYIERYIETGKGKIIGVGPREVTGRRKDGSTFDLEIAVSAMMVGETRMFIGVMRDVTRRKATEAQLRQAQKMEAVGQLTGGVAHDFNNLLAVIMGNLELIDEGLAGEAQLRELVGHAIGAAERGAELTQRLLAFSRRQALRPEVVDLNNLVGGMTGLLARTLGETVEFETVQAGGLWKTVVDPGQLENALLNLTLNARAAMPRGGKLTVETANAHLDQDYADAHDEVEPGQYVLLAVSDTGSGMPRDVMDRIFEPFFTTKEEGRGSGLGLSMVFGFIKQSGGHIKFYSEVGEGTTAKLYLPRTRRQPEEYRAPGPPTSAQLGRGEVVLVVEDDAIVRKMAMNLLESLGYRVLGAEDGPSALDLLEGETAVDLLLTDVVLPGSMSGRDVAREALVRRPGLKVLYTSGYSANAVVRNGIVDEGVELVSKPYRKELLARLVRKSLDRDDR